MLDSVRTRLTIWYVGVLTVGLMTFSLSVYVLLEINLQRRTDAALSAALDSMQHLLEYERTEGDTEVEAARNTVAELGYPNINLAVFTADGQLLAETQTPGKVQTSLPVPPLEITEKIRYLTLADVRGPNQAGWRIAIQRVRALPTDAPNLIVARQSLQTVLQEMESLRQVLAVVVPLAMVLSGLGGWFLVNKSLVPIAAMSEQAQRIGADNLEDRLPVANPRDEFGKLAVTFNQLLTRLNDAFDSQRQFMADASHELRTPLSVIHTTAQVILDQSHREEGEYRNAVALMDAQTQRLARIVTDMFTLARADAGHHPLEPVDFYFDELLVETLRAAQILGTRKGIAVTMEPASETYFRGDEGLLRQMLLSVLDNAIKHTPTGGRVTVTLTRAESTISITVVDTGTGIPPEAQPFIFDRFFRVDTARTRAEASTEGGAGLGLSIARWIAQAHNGKLELLRSDHQGSVFVVTLPVLLENNSLDG